MENVFDIYILLYKVLACKLKDKVRLVVTCEISLTLYTEPNDINLKASKKNIPLYETFSCVRHKADFITQDRNLEQTDI